MTLLMIVAVILTLVAVESFRVVTHDGRGAKRPPRSHFQDPQFQPPSGW